MAGPPSPASPAWMVSLLNAACIIALQVPRVTTALGASTVRRSDYPSFCANTQALPGLKMGVSRYCSHAAGMQLHGLCVKCQKADWILQLTNLHQRQHRMGQASLMQRFDCWTVNAYANQTLD